MIGYWGNLVVQFSIYLIAALSLNLIIGYCGLFSLCHAALFGIGAYTAALLMTKLGMNFLLASICAAVAGGVASLAVSFPSVRLKGDAFALCTLVFQVATVDLLNNLVGLTGGPFGISGIPAPSLFGFDFHNVGAFALLAALMCSGAIYAAWATDRSAFGRTMLAVRNDELAARTLGKNVFAVRVVACAVAGSIVALGGAIYAGYFGYVEPNAFLLGESFVMLTMVVMGGSGNIVGPFIGAFILVMVPEMLRLLNISSVVGPNIKQMLFGAALVMLMLMRPQGLWGRYAIK